jgi:hypothetical protein
MPSKAEKSVAGLGGIHNSSRVGTHITKPSSELGHESSASWAK